jgi:hypothetical protein
VRPEPDLHWQPGDVPAVRCRDPDMLRRRRVQRALAVSWRDLPATSPNSRVHDRRRLSRRLLQYHDPSVLLFCRPSLPDRGDAQEVLQPLRQAGVQPASQRREEELPEGRQEELPKEAPGPRLARTSVLRHRRARWRRGSTKQRQPNAGETGPLTIESMHRSDAPA